MQSPNPALNLWLTAGFARFQPAPYVQYISKTYH